MLSIVLVLLLVLVLGIYFNNDQGNVVCRCCALLKTIQAAQYGILNVCRRKMRILANNIVNCLLNLSGRLKRF
jgi:hypothetical protein